MVMILTFFLRGWGRDGGHVVLSAITDLSGIPIQKSSENSPTNVEPRDSNPESVLTVNFERSLVLSPFTFRAELFSTEHTAALSLAHRPSISFPTDRECRLSPSFNAPLPNALLSRSGSSPRSSLPMNALSYHGFTSPSCLEV